MFLIDLITYLKLSLPTLVFTIRTLRNSEELKKKRNDVHKFEKNIERYSPMKTKVGESGINR
jgi:hypothetical protein